VSLTLTACAPLGPPGAGSGSAPDHAARTAAATGTSGPASTAGDEHPGVHAIPANAAPGRAAAGSPVAIAQATHEYPSAPVAQSVSATATSPIAAVQAFAHAYINWSASTVAADMRALAVQSVGQARSAMQLAAAQTGRDYELRRGGVANQGSVEAIAPLSGTGEQYAVVTLERTTATATDAYQGLQPAWHVAVAAVTQVAAGRWAVSDWQPES
jgi:hypothetical protein